MLISEVAKRTGLSVHTLRYYEKEGLLKGLARNGSGQRVFSASDLEWIVWIKRLKSTGMKLADIRRFAQLRLHGDTSLAARKQILIDHSHALKNAIESQQKELSIVEAKISAYEEKLQT